MGGQLYRTAWIFYLVLAVGGALWAGWQQGTIPLTLFVDPATWPADLGMGLAAAAGLLGFWEAGRRFLPSARELERLVAELLAGVELPELLGLALLSGFAEELFFRGAMQAAWGWVPATILFALLHSGPGSTYRAWILFAAIAGLTLAGLMLWRGNLLAPVVAHTTVNAVNLARIARARRSGEASSDARPSAEPE